MGALSNKGERGQRNREEEFYFSRGFAARSRALRARISPGSTKPPYYAGYCMPRVPTRNREMSAECPYQKSGVLAREDRTVLKTRGVTLLYKLVPPHRIGFLRWFGLKTGIHFAHFGLESGMVFEGTTGVYERIYRFNSK